MREISLLKGFAVAPRDGNAAAGFGKDLVIIKVIDIGQVHQVAAVISTVSKRLRYSRT